MQNNKKETDIKQIPSRFRPHSLTKLIQLVGDHVANPPRLVLINIIGKSKLERI